MKFCLKSITKMIFGIILSVFWYSSAHSADITTYRIGQHPDFVRIVLETPQKTRYTSTISRNELTISLKNTGWKLKKQPHHPSEITNVSYKKLGKDLNFVATFSYPIKIKTSYMMGNPLAEGYKIVIDVGKLKTTRKANSTNKASKKQKFIPTPVFKPSLHKPVIVIDPGHGGVDPGAIGVSKTYEKHITMKYSKALKTKLDAIGKYKVILTHNDDKYLKLRERVDLARKYKGDLFVSLHADYSDNKRARGLSVYTLSDKASDAETEKLAMRENKADIIMGFDLSHERKDVTNILIDLARQQTLNNSSIFAETLVKKCKKSVKTISNPHRSAGFAVLKSPSIPSVLVELGFISNRTDEKLLKTATHRRKIISCITNAIDEYF